MKVIIKFLLASCFLFFGLISCDSQSRAEKEFPKSIEDATTAIEKAVEEVEDAASEWENQYKNTTDDYYQEDKKNEGEVYYDVYGRPSNHISTCYTCGTSYTVETLPYMNKYCSQACCGAYEGLHPSCGY